MKKTRAYTHMFLLLVALLLVCGIKKEVKADTAVIDGIEYTLNDGAAFGRIENIRGDHLKTELYVPRWVNYKGKAYKVLHFTWGEYENYFMDYDDPNGYLVREIWQNLWKQNITIPDKARSYQACLRKITIAKGVKIYGAAYGYDKLRRVITEDANSFVHVYYNNCPKLKKLHLPAKVRRGYIDIKNCPSLQVSIDKRHKNLKVIGKDIYSKDGKVLWQVVNGKKNYRVRKGVVGIGEEAFWGNTAIEKIYLPDKCSLPSGLGGMPNFKFIRLGEKAKRVFLADFLPMPELKRLDLPKSTREIYGPLEGFIDKEKTTVIRKIYVRADSLKAGRLNTVSDKITFYVQNKKVKRQLRKFGFTGNIVIQKKMKSFDKVK